MTTILSAPSEAPYDQLASAYDLITAGYGHERWLAEIERLASIHGMSGRRMLDVACGTGKSFLPMLSRGYQVTACDISAQMAARAGAKADGRADVHVADMRTLPRLGSFDLVTCLDDAINHLLEPEEVTASLAGMQANLASGGVVVFDVNTFAAYENVADWTTEDERQLVVWRGAGVALASPGGRAEVVVELFTRTADGLWERTTARQGHRHYPVDEVRLLAERAGLEVVGEYGQRPGVVVEPSIDEERDHKAIFVARSAA